jgi:hypothetical protein
VNVTGTEVMNGIRVHCLTDGIFDGSTIIRKILKSAVYLIMNYSFQAADLDDVFKENVRKSQYEKPTPIQKWAIPAVLRGRDIMGCAQTGSGKTVSYVNLAWKPFLSHSLCACKCELFH